jgi:hypothetical protein
VIRHDILFLVHYILDQIASDTNVEEGSRKLAFEALVCLAESDPAMVRKFPSFAQRVIPLALNVRSATLHERG